MPASTLPNMTLDCTTILPSERSGSWKLEVEVEVEVEVSEASKSKNTLYQIEDLANQQFKEELLAEIKGLISTALIPVIQQLNSISQKVDKMDALQQNSLKTRHEALNEVPNEQGHLPSAQGLEFPRSLNQLLVAGNERIPVTNEMNDWSKTKSRQLLMFYGATGGYDSETENEYTPTARSSRLRLAKVLGVSSVQLQQAAASLADF